jgi:hypothetical protein
MSTSTSTSTEEQDTNWAGPLVAALPDMWALFAEHSDGLVDVWRLMGVCKRREWGRRSF